MKTFTFLLAAGLITAAASAETIRVSNVTGSSAPYTTLDDALAAAAEGDTIMVDGSATAYDCTNLRIDKRVVIIGPGYFLIENGTTQTSTSPATLAGEMRSIAKGVVLKGLTFSSSLKVAGDNTTVTRCRLSGGIVICSASYAVIHQNYIPSIIAGRESSADSYSSYAQITNNLIRGAIPGVSCFDYSNIQYNTFYNMDVTIQSCSSTNIADNIIWKNNPDYYMVGCTLTNNISYDTQDFSWGNGLNTDKNIQEREFEYFARSLGAGAWAGDDPYVLSGVPAGPVIESVQMPVSVEQGKQLPVTVTIKVQQ